MKKYSFYIFVFLMYCVLANSVAGIRIKEKNQQNKNTGAVTKINSHQPLTEKTFFSIDRDSATNRFDMKLVNQRIQQLKKTSEQLAILKNIRLAKQTSNDELSSIKTTEISQMPKITLMGKPTRFRQASLLSTKESVYQTHRMPVTSARINNKLHDSIYVDEPITLTFSFAPNSASALVSIYIDTEEDGIIGNKDLLIVQDMLLLDNDDNDENLLQGEYALRFRSNDQLNRYVSTLLFEINDYSSVSTVSLTVQQHPTQSVVEGITEPPIPNILLNFQAQSDPLRICTDSTGKFSFFVDRQQESKAYIYCLNTQNGFEPPSVQELTIVSDTTETVLRFTPSTSFIEGYIKDQMGNGVKDVTMRAFNSFEVTTKSDTSGYYKIGVTEGQWEVSIQSISASGYLQPIYSYVSVLVFNNGIAHKDFQVIKANNTISGKVTIEGTGNGGIPVNAFTDSLKSLVLTTSDGSYEIPVFQPPGAVTLYVVNPVFEVNGYTLVNPKKFGEKPGTTNINFEIKKVSSGIKGRILDNDGSPIAGAYIFMNGPQQKSVSSNDSGFFHTSLLNGKYSLTVYASPFYNYNDSIIVANNEVTKNIIMFRSGSFSGTVKNEEGKLINNGYIYAIDSLGNVATLWYFVNGEYTVSGLKTGKYKAYVRDNDFVTQWYNNGEDFWVTEGSDTPNIDFVLPHGGSISGKVVSTTGEPIANVEVAAVHGHFVYASDVTNDSGFYSITGLVEGLHKVVARNEDYVTQYYDGVANFEEATELNVIANQDIPNITFTLAEGCKISGKVKDKNGMGIRNILVLVFDSLRLYPREYSGTDDSGYFMFKGLLPFKKYYLMTGGTIYAQRWYDNILKKDLATPIILQPEEHRENINFTLSMGGLIVGHLRDVLGNPIYNEGVIVVDSTGNSFASSTSDFQGSYLLSGLSTGDYYIKTSSYNYLEQWFNHKAAFGASNKVSVMEEDTVFDIDFDLQKAAGIFGTIVDDSSKLGLYNINVEAYSTRGDIGYLVYSGTNGNYFLPLPAEKILLRVQPYFGDVKEYLPQYYNSKGGVILQTDGEEISIVDGQLPKEINFSLQKVKDYYAFNNEKLGMTITNHGSFSYQKDSALPKGRWPLASSPNYLFDGNIWVGGKLDDRVLVSGGPFDGLNGIGEWAALSNYKIESDSIRKHVETFYTDMDSYYGETIRWIIVKQNSYSWKYKDFAIYKYTVTFPPFLGGYVGTLQNTYIGFFMDFDIADGGMKDMVGIDNSNNLVYMFDSTSANNVVTGVRLLSGTVKRLSYWGINDDPLPSDDTLQYQRLSQNNSITAPDHADDYRIFVSSGPYNIMSGKSVSVAIAVVAGNNVSELVNSSKEALAMYSTILEVPESVSENIPGRFSLSQNYPNPFNPSTTIKFSLPIRSEIRLFLVNMLGQVVKEITKGTYERGYYQVVMNGSNLASGVYFYRMDTNTGFAQTKKLLLLK